MPVLEVEVDSDKNADLIFSPLQKLIRGRFDVARAVKTDTDAAPLFREWTSPIPGQRIGLDTKTGKGHVADPLHFAEYAATAEKLRKRFQLPPACEEFDAHVPTWLHFLKRAVESGLARVVVGELPDTIEGEPKLSFYVQHEKEKDTDRLAKAIEAQTDVFTKLLAELLANKRGK